MVSEILNKKCVISGVISVEQIQKKWKIHFGKKIRRIFTSLFLTCKINNVIFFKVTVDSKRTYPNTLDMVFSEEKKTSFLLAQKRPFAH